MEVRIPVELYISKKHSADSLSKSLGVQFPSDQQAYDSIYGSIAYFGEKVNIAGKKLSEIIASSKTVINNGSNHANQGYRQENRSKNKEG